MRFMFAIVFMLGLISHSHAQGLPQTGLTWGQPFAAPALMLTDQTGSPKLLENYRGQPLLINLWATWCAPCVQEMPSLNALQNAYAGRLTVLPISFDAGPNTVAHMYHRMGLTELPILMGEQADVSARLGATSLPMSYLVNSSGQIVASVSGAMDWLAPEILLAMERFLPQPNAAEPTINDVVF